MAMSWRGDPVVSRGVCERAFDVAVDGRTVPAIVWTPEGASEARPLVLIGHGYTLHKRTEYVLSLARGLVRHHGIAAAAIDGPGHGERGEETLVSAAESLARGLTPAWWSDTVTDEVVAEWQAALDTLQRLPEIGAGPVGYWGVSMGTIFGLPFVAAEPRVRVAVLGLMGVVGPTMDRIARDAGALDLPVLFVLQSDDELFAREHGLALFDAIGSRDKRLHVNPGAHSAMPPDEFVDTERFLATRLAALVGAEEARA